MMDSIPVVCITGQVPESLIGSDAFQETDVTGITLTITKHNFLVTKAAEIAPALRKAFAIAADATFAIAGITASTAIYYTFRDKGAPSTGLIDVRAIALTPQVGSGYAGVGMEVNW